jgi:lipoate-protein ligase B
MKSSTESPSSASPEIIDCGLADYRLILERQHELRESRRLGKISDTVLVVEHQPVITLGARRSANKLIAERAELADRNIDIVNIRRGGGTTAHNPGQLVLYPILDLQELGLGISEYVRTLELIGIELLDEFGVRSEQREGLPGLWIARRKIASIGVRVSKFITYHGMAINIYNDLSIFDTFVPCGLDGVEMTSVLKETGNRPSMDEVKERLFALLRKHLQRPGA